MVSWIGLTLVVAGVLLILGGAGWNVASALQRRSDEEYERGHDKQ